MRKLGFMLSILVLTTSCNDCLYYAKKFRERKFDMVVQKKHIESHRDIYIEGIDLNGKKVLFHEVSFSELYNMVEIGDTMRKQLGTSNIKLFRKDTCLVYRWNCDGRRVD